MGEVVNLEEAVISRQVAVLLRVVPGKSEAEARELLRELKEIAAGEHKPKEESGG